MLPILPVMNRDPICRGVSYCNAPMVGMVPFRQAGRCDLCGTALDHNLGLTLGVLHGGGPREHYMQQGQCRSSSTTCQPPRGRRGGQAESQSGLRPAPSVDRGHPQPPTARGPGRAPAGPEGEGDPRAARPARRHAGAAAPPAGAASSDAHAYALHHPVLLFC